MVLTNWKFVATVRGIGFQPVESKPFPLAQNPPPTQDLPRRGYFSQPGVAASAATPGKIPPRSPLPCQGCVRFGAWKIVGFTCLAPGERSNPDRIESALFGGFTWGSRRCGNPRLREVSPLGNFSDVASNTSCWVVVIGLGTRLDWHEQIFKFVLRTDAGPRRAGGRPGSRSMVLTNWKFVATVRGIGFQPVCEKHRSVWGRWAASCRWEAGMTLDGADKLEVCRHGPWDRLRACL